MTNAFTTAAALRKKAYVIVDAYSSGRMFIDRFKAKFSGNPDVVFVHVQSTPFIMKQMAVFEAEKYAENIVHNGDLGATVAALKKYDVQAVMVGQEPGVELADALSEALQLPSSNGTAKSKARRDKYEMIKTVADAKLAAPKFIKSKQLPEILAWIKNVNNNEYPVVLKVLRSASTDGVYICSNANELTEAFNKSIGHKTIMEEVNYEVLVESFLKGDEYVVDSVSHGGQHYLLGVWKYQKRFIPGHGNIYDKETLLPSSDPMVQKLAVYNSQMLDALEVKYGPAHAEIMYTPDQGPALVEVGTRLNGVVHPDLHNECLGHNQVDLTIDCYSDQKAFDAVVSKLPYQRRKHAMVVNLINDGEGIIEGINEHVVAEMRNLPSVVDMVIKFKPGQTLVPTRNLLQSPIRFFMRHENEAQLEKDYQTIQRLRNQLFQLAPKPTNDKKKDDVRHMTQFAAVAKAPPPTTAQPTVQPAEPAYKPLLSSRL